MQKKSGIMKSGLEAMPLFLLDDLLWKKFALANLALLNPKTPVQLRLGIGVSVTQRLEVFKSIT
jgi:hypothetical protein